MRSETVRSYNSLVNKHDSTTQHHMMCGATRVYRNMTGYFFHHPPHIQNMC